MASLLDAYRLLHDGALALAEVERAGIHIDVEYCREKLAWVDEQSRRSDRRLRSSELGRACLARFGSSANFSSDPQLRAVLYADLGVKPFKQTAHDQDSVDEESLRQTTVDGIDHLLRLRSLKKMSEVLGGFVRYQIGGTLYPTFSLHTVITYRSSSSDPNLQNVPTRDKEQMDVCRRAIVPSPGHVILEIDFSGIEVAVAACYHKDPAMLEYLRDPAADMHSDAAKKLFFLDGVISDLKKLDGFVPILRQAGKNAFIFPQFYGDWYESCAPGIACGWCKLPRLGDWSDDDGCSFDGRPIARHLRQHDVRGLVDFTEHVRTVENWLWNERFPVYSRWRRDWYARYQRRGSFAMKTGFVCGGVMGRNQATNFPVQGPAFHLLLKALILVVRRTRGWVSRVIGEVHDSLLIDADLSEVPALVEMVRRIAAEELPRIWPWIIVPLRVEAKASEVDGSWANMRVVE
jgi:DNA polymerase I-like protein with 3'-5' exonuclease and polymerase domains